jgi:hypothetical protein
MLIMANLSSEIIIRADLRPCIVNNRKALFHKWSDKSKVVSPSPMVGGPVGGVINYTVGIIEYEDGVVTECYPYEIRFVDGEFQKYCFKD